MKTTITVILILFSYCNLFSQVWETTNIVGGNENTRGTYFANPNTGYVTINNHSSSFKIYKTINKGANWTLKKNFNNPVTLENPQNMVFINENTGWISFTEVTNVAYKAYVYKTTNGGNNWDLKHSSSTENGGILFIGKLYFVDSNVGYLIYDQSSKIYKTGDGGSSWVLKYENSTNYIINLAFSKNNSDVIYAGGYSNSNPSKPFLIKSTDGFNGTPSSILDGSSDPGNFRYLNSISIVNSDGNDLLKFLCYSGLYKLQSNNSFIQINSLNVLSQISFVNEN